MIYKFHSTIDVYVSLKHDHAHVCDVNNYLKREHLESAVLSYISWLDGGIMMFFNIAGYDSD